MAYEAAKKRYDEMVYGYCGKSGLKLPMISLGFWHNFGTVDSFNNMREMCFTALDHGITHFDLANNYGPLPGSAESNLGKIMREELHAYRDELLISTKAGYLMWDGPYGDFGSRKYLLSSLDQSLQRMGLEYVDIFYHHRMDPNTPLEESMMALDTAVKRGKALYAGISNYDWKHTKKAIEIMQNLRCPFIVDQVRYSIFDRWIEEDGLKKKAAENGMGLIAFSPLAQGLLTNKYIDGIPQDSRMKRDGRFLKEEALTKKRLEQIKALHKIAENRGQSLAQMALSWVLRDNDVTSVLIGASKPSQIIENIGIIHKTAFSEGELNEIDRISCLEIDSK